ncbi:KATNAL2 [Branchiostoma lanceolatum]|uniref:Katanin p60 ATPase-containing subunit A-like 2 n=1 Tax=Branchiostoma lanceolatum TaxID=7740 RepID=A0A8J9ZH16_BRALA|nr:KATNAL2 [Branchiostoma lanceolatum]
MTELSYQALKTANQAREADEQRVESRRKNLLMLILHYLNTEGYLESVKSLEHETNLSLRKFEVCDNIDLETILQEYESYFYIKFQKYPKITKKLASSADSANSRVGRGGKLRRSGSTVSLPRIPLDRDNAEDSGKKEAASPKRSKPSSGTRKPPAAANKKGVAKDSKQDATVGDSTDLGLTVSAAPTSNGTIGSDKEKPHHEHGRKQVIDMRSMLQDAIKGASREINMNSYDSSSDRLLKPLGGYVGYNSEWRELAQTISRDIYLNNPDVRWDDIIGLDAAKRLVKESVVYPIKYPKLFTGILSPWKGLLLYGPPGTGKTLLAKAVATECNTTFFNISASSIVSKWRGDSEKLVRVLFELARFHAPSTIFLDELESVMGQRGSGPSGNEHEGSRRMKTELLVQMDGLAKSDDLVFLLAASNLPWELDHAMLRRLEKRILVDLPTKEARHAMVQFHLPRTINQGTGVEITTDLDYEHLAECMEGYSGADIRLVCKEAAMMKVRKVFDVLENHGQGDHLPDLKIDPILTSDVKLALVHTKPSARTLKDKYAAWQKEYESV